MSDRPPLPVETFNAAVANTQAGRYAEAEAGFREIIRTHPELLQAHSNLGIVLRQLGRPDEAINVLIHAVGMKGDYFPALQALSTVLLERNRLDEALEVLLRQLKLCPDDESGLINTGNILMRRDQPERAEPYYRQALAISPGNGTILNNLGACLLSQKRALDGAVLYRRALRVQPGTPEWEKNLGTCLLMAGDFPQGTLAYEGRLRQPVWQKRGLTTRPWLGEPLDGRTLLVHYEQGLGDSFQFIRYMPILKQMGARVLFECQKGMKRVLSSAPGIDEMISHGDPLPPYDYHVSLMSLMHLLGTTPDNTPRDVPYLWAEPALVADWRRRMDEAALARNGNADPFRIAINWRGNEIPKSIPLEQFAGLAALPGVQLYSMQKVVGLDQLEAVGPRLGIVSWTDTLDAGPDKFVDTAALMTAADLIVSGDTSIVHLAGALGRPIIMPLKYFADWRWMLDREDSPWYPSMRILRQRRRDDWAELMGRVTDMVAGDLAARRT